MEIYMFVIEGGDIWDNMEMFVVLEIYFNQFVLVYGRGICIIFYVVRFFYLDIYVYLLCIKLFI